jgi:hypothetical protein
MSINIPEFSSKERNEIKEIVTEIIEIERNYLKEMQDVDDESIAYELTSSHNESTVGLCAKIDEIIYDNLNMTSSDREYIEKLVTAKNQFLYSGVNSVTLVDTRD